MFRVYISVTSCVLLSTLFGFSSAQFTKNVGDSCQLPSGNSGQCKVFDDCDLHLLSKESSQPVICNLADDDVIVCCPSPGGIQGTPPRSPTSNYGSAGSKSEQKCEEYRKIKSQQGTGTIIGGENVEKVEEYPHSALLGYGNPPSWQCGGTLISEKFILTAAHCLNGNNRAAVSTAHLGFLDKNNRNQFGTLQEFSIIRTYKHPSRKAPKQYADIALLELDRPVQFSKGVVPACLYQDNKFTVKSAQAIGWGDVVLESRKGSDILQKVKLSLVDFNECSDKYPPNRKLPEGIIHDTQFCAGDYGKDTCQGDSGGPLQIHDTYGTARIIGITSFGQKCGLQPGVYTRVSAFIPWIESIVWP